MKSRPLTVWAGSTVILVVGVMLWALASRRVFVIPTPVATLAALGSDLGDQGYQANLVATAQGAAVAFAISVGIGVGLGLPLGLSRRLRQVLLGLLVALNGLPKIVLYPLLLLLFGMGLPSKIAMGAMFGAFPVMLNLAAGLTDLPPIYARLGRSLRANGLQMLLHIYLPATLGPFLTGVRLAFSLSLVGVVLAEILATRFGLGRVIEQSYSLGRYPEMMGTILLLLSASFIGSVAIWSVERRVSR